MKTRTTQREAKRAERPRRRLASSMLSRLLRETEGTATVEAVIMIPFFVLVWGFLIYAVQVYADGIRAGVRARDCAWTYAQTGCDSVPAQCQSEPADGEVIDAGAESGVSELLTNMREIPVVGGLLETIFGRLVVGVHNEEVTRPNILGGGGVQVQRSFAVMCNERPRTIGEIAQDIACGFIDLFCD